MSLPQRFEYPPERFEYPPDISPPARFDYPPNKTSPLADPSSRLIARLIDWVAPAAPALLLVPIGQALGSPLVIRVGFVCCIVALLVVLVLNLHWLHRDGQTLGKRFMQLRIVRTDGSRATLGRILGLRILIPAVIETIPILGWIFWFVNPLFIFSRDRRCLHDQLADTIVVDVRQAVPAAALQA